MNVGGVVSSYIVKEALVDKTPETIKAVKEALADHIACAIAGSEAKVSIIAKKYTKAQWGVGVSSVFLEKEKVTPAGAAFVNAVMANALDIDDGHRLTKGHPGAIVIPAILAAAEELKSTGEEFIIAVLIGYEVGIRAGIIAHRKRPEYHCTGSWGAIGAAAGVSRILGLSEQETEHALGIAEYHSTYSPMMRCIEHPSMLKDGIGWGCMTGLSSAYLAKLQFTGIPSLFSSNEGREYVQELGTVERIHQLYYKPHACCRWAQPAVECLKELVSQTDIKYEEIEKIIVYTFTESASLSHQAPTNTEEAQYNLLFPLASYLVFGEVGPKQILYELQNQNVLDVMGKIETRVNKKFDETFPTIAQSQVEIHTKAGRVLYSSVLQARGDYDFPLIEAEKEEKFYSLTTPIIGEKRSRRLLECIRQLEKLDDIGELLSIINE
ncbi:MmgE/PrpD family protein [Paenisporosarcina antarctica]|uniref:MmgE/PrpD family protein n=1 Tax=Paenisporosarcina antarctica TaxID=417367 RepID=A0A4P6ZZU9_9BACL|nr:MmgE/PrpD family protein [Paenisporosarcina antarctica]QBP41844.1 MmgE/PrpD family protein [Paenisporosarcina antarctica]